MSAQGKNALDSTTVLLKVRRISLFRALFFAMAIASDATFAQCVAPDQLTPLSINAGSTLVNTSYTACNALTFQIQKNGELDNQGSVNNSGLVSNSGLWTNDQGSHLFVSAGTFANNGVFTALPGSSVMNYSSFNNLQGGKVTNDTSIATDAGTLANAGMLTNKTDGTLYFTGGILQNSGSLANAGELFSTVTITNTGTLINTGRIDATADFTPLQQVPSVITNSGTLNNFYIIEVDTLKNSGLVTVGATGSLGAGSLYNSGIISGQGSVGVSGGNNTGSMTVGDLAISGFGGSFDNQGKLVISNGGTNAGAFTNEATVNLSGYFANNQTGQIGNSGQYFLTGTIHNIGLISNTGTFSNAGTLTNSKTFENSGTFINTAAGTFNNFFGSLVNTGTFTTAGQFIASLTDFSPVSGNGVFIEEAGLVQVDGAMAQRSININGGLFEGNGILTSAVDVHGGTLSAGEGIGSLAVNGSLTFTGGTLLTEIGGLGLGGNDLLQVSGPVTFSEGSLEFAFLNGFTPKVGDQWIFLEGSQPIVLPTTISTEFFGVSGADQFSVISANDQLELRLTNIAAVPEPSTTALLLAGLITLAASYGGRQKRRSNRIIA